MKNRGSLVVIVLLSAGILVSCVAVWYHRQQTQRPLELWGATGSQLIEHAPEVTLYRLTEAANKSAPDNRHTIRIRDRAYSLSDDRDMEGAAGFSHVRWGLCQDSSFIWEKDCDSCDKPAWDYAIRFVKGNQQLTLVFDIQCALITQLDEARCVSIEPIAEEVKVVLERQSN